MRAGLALMVTSGLWPSAVFSSMVVMGVLQIILGMMSAAQHDMTAWVFASGAFVCLFTAGFILTWFWYQAVTSRGWSR